MIMTWEESQRYLIRVISYTVRDVDRMVRDGNDDGNCIGEYGGMWEIRGTTYLIGFRIPSIGILICQIWSHTCHFGYGKMTCTSNSLKSQLLIIIYLIFYHLLNTHPQPYNYNRIQSNSISLFVSIT